jgi:hypothetical protein
LPPPDRFGRNAWIGSKRNFSPPSFSNKKESIVYVRAAEAAAAAAESIPDMQGYTSRL